MEKVADYQIGFLRRYVKDNPKNSPHPVKSGLFTPII